MNGRTYICAAGSTLDVPDFDAYELEANGWAVSAAGGVGATSQRPVNWGKNQKGQFFHDTTLGYNILWNGVRFVNPTNGTAA